MRENSYINLLIIWVESKILKMTKIIEMVRILYPFLIPGYIPDTKNILCKNKTITYKCENKTSITFLKFGGWKHNSKLHKTGNMKYVIGKFRFIRFIFFQKKIKNSDCGLYTNS